MSDGKQNILMTGATGFLGKTIYKVLMSLPYDITTIGRTNGYSTKHINFDLGIDNNLAFSENYDLVLHCAGKAHVVPKNNEQKKEFYTTNFLGTQQLLKGLETLQKKPKSFVFISSVAVYGLIEGANITENTALNAKDAYGHSKILAEKAILDWCNQNDILCTILRLPLVIGSNSSGNLKAMITSINNGYYFNIAGGKSRKSMVLAKDVASFIPIVASVGGIYNLTDGLHPSFWEMSNYIAQKLNKTQPKNINKKVLTPLVRIIGDYLPDVFPIDTNKIRKMTTTLTFDDAKARAIGWQPQPVIGNFNP